MRDGRAWPTPRKRSPPASAQSTQSRPESGWSKADERVRTVGRGGWPNILGEVELDAAIMDGDSRRTGAIGALKGYLHPISVARAVLEKLPHELLVGEGAARFAHDIGAQRGENLVDDSAAAWRSWVAENLSAEELRQWPAVALAEHCWRGVDPERGRDTTVFLAHDANGSIASGVSTSGWAWKHPGRLGDSPIIGAGSYADSRYGAAACTGAGEMAIRCGTARSVVLGMKAGMSVDDAVAEAARDLGSLQGGLVSRVTVHAIDTVGRLLRSCGQHRGDASPLGVARYRRETPATTDTHHIAR